jgi:TM2 domain-containing membrane protein YozV
MRTLDDADILVAGSILDSDALAARLDGQRKKRRYAYLAWLCLGSHYLYLGRPFVQALFWLTFGGLLFWWVADLFRMSSIVERRNRRAASRLLKSWQSSVEQRRQESRAPPLWPTHPKHVEPQPEPIAAFAPQPPAVFAPAPIGTGRGWEFRTGAVLALAVALTTAVAVRIAAPPPLYPRAAAEPSYRTMRQTNVRQGPSTASPIRAVLERDVLLIGEVKEASARGPSRWLRITRGDHADRYVALQNLERR